MQCKCAVGALRAVSASASSVHLRKNHVSVIHLKYVDAHSRRCSVGPRLGHIQYIYVQTYKYTVCLRYPGVSGLAVHGPVDEIEEDVGTREDHPGVLVDGVRVLDDVEGAQAPLLLGGGGLAAHGQVHHHVLGLLRHAVHLLLLLGAHGVLRVARQAVGVGLAVRAVQHGHGARVGDPAGAGQGLLEGRADYTDKNRVNRVIQ